MARSTHGTSDTLDEIQSVADQMAAWIQAHLVLVAGSIAGLLLLAGLVSYGLSAGNAAEQEASIALAKTRTAYLAAMGAGPGAIEVPELASPDAAKRIREEYGARFAEIADAHAGTVSGGLARMEVAQLALDAGDTPRAIAIYEKVLEEGAGGDRFRGIVLQRIAQALEDTERWDAAAERHEQAADLKDFPLRHWALADAARCRAQAGDREAAHALYQRLAREAPDLRLPDYQRAEMRELDAAATL